MPKYIVKTSTELIWIYTVEADSADEAEDMVADGDCDDPVDSAEDGEEVIVEVSLAPELVPA